MKKSDGSEYVIPDANTNNSDNECGSSRNDTIATVSLCMSPSVSTINKATNEPTCSTSPETDIGYHINCNESLDDFTRAALLEKHWTPPVNYNFPYNIVRKNGKDSKKYAQRSHLDKFYWLVLSDKDRGLYCKYCALFAHTTAGKGLQTPLKRLVTEPLKQFDDLMGVKGAFAVHEKNQYHIRAVEAGKSFLVRFHEPSLDIRNQLSSQREKQVNENRERLTAIIKTIIFCGQQNIALRGHRDSGPLRDNDNNSPVNEGNFRALLKFQIDAGNKKLEEHLNSSSNATYISKRIQNEIIDLCKEEIQNTIISNVKEAECFTILFDETTDISHMEQLSLSFRYLKNNIIREDFVAFCDAYSEIRKEDVQHKDDTRLTGVALAHIVIDLCKKFGLDLKNCVGIGTDSCSVMSSEVKGAVTELMKLATHAKKCPCNNHILNNSLAKSSKVTSCRNASATMKKLVAFANASAKRNRVFKDALGSKLESLCDTRWVERHDGYLQFQGDALVKLCEALSKISTWLDSKSASDADCLRHALCSSDFIIASICLSDVLGEEMRFFYSFNLYTTSQTYVHLLIIEISGATVSLSRFLQKKTIDLMTASNALKDTLNVLLRKRENAEESFHNLFVEAQNLAEKLGTIIKAPRTVPRQTHRDNYQGNDEEYFRRTVYIPLLDSINGDLKDRLPADTMNLFGLGVFMPKSEYTEEDLGNVKKLSEFYSHFLDAPASTIVTEYQLWISKWKREIEENITSKVPSCVVSAIEACDDDLYPNVKTMMKILATLPISAATAERSFSTLRRLKTWMRANMLEDRLTGLALLNIHPDMTPSVSNIINRFANSKRRLPFVL